MAISTPARSGRTPALQCVPRPRAACTAREVTQAALQATLAAVQRFAGGEREAPVWTARSPAGPLATSLAPERTRGIDWVERRHRHRAAPRLRSADGQPGVLDALWGQPCYLGDAHAASAATVRRIQRCRTRRLAGRARRRAAAPNRRRRRSGSARHAAPTRRAHRRAGQLQAGGGRAVRQRSVRGLPQRPRAAGARAPTSGTSCATPNTARGRARGLPGLRLLQRRHVHRALRAPARRAALGARARHAGAGAAGRRRLLQQRHRPATASRPRPTAPGDSAADASWRNIKAMNDVALGAAADHRPAHRQRAARQRGRGWCVSRARGRSGVGARRRGAQPALQEHGQPVRLRVLDLPAAAPPGRGAARSD